MATANRMNTASITGPVRRLPGWARLWFLAVCMVFPYPPEFRQLLLPRSHILQSSACPIGDVHRADGRVVSSSRLQHPCAFRSGCLRRSAANHHCWSRPTVHCVPRRSPLSSSTRLRFRRPRRSVRAQRAWLPSKSVGLRPVSRIPRGQLLLGEQPPASHRAAQDCRNVPLLEHHSLSPNAYDKSNEVQIISATGSVGLVSLSWVVAEQTSNAIFPKKSSPAIL